MYQSQQLRTEEREHHYDLHPTVQQVDQELRELSDAQIDRLAAKVDYKVIGRYAWANLTTQERRQWRAGEEQARRQQQRERAAREAAQARIFEADQQARADAQIAAYKEQAREAWVGDQESFDRAWPELLQRWQIARVDATVDSNSRHLSSRLSF